LLCNATGRAVNEPETSTSIILLHRLNPKFAAIFAA
jgi:hypothetical protein